MNIATPKLVADVTDECTIRGSDKVNIRGANEINIGEYQPPDQTGVGGTLPETSIAVNIKAVDLVKIESADVIDIDAGGAMTVDTVAALTITGGTDLNLVVGGNVLLDVYFPPVEGWLVSEWSNH